MKNRKIYPLVCILFGAMLLPCNKAQAQIHAQSDLFSVLENTCSYYLDVIANDNLDTAQLSLQILLPPQNGSASVNVTGRYLSYCPNQGFLGADQFTYKVISSIGTDSATVFINVEAYNNFIFAGDADQNGRVENFDVLALGLAYNLKGPSRFNTNSANTLAWEPSVYINTNPGAADCNGDGIVDANDMAPIESAYHDTFPYPAYFEIDTSACSSSGKPFYIQLISPDTVHDGDDLLINFNLVDNAGANDVYGIAFTLEFDNRFIPGNAVQFFTSSSWMLQNDPGLFFSRSFQSSGEIEIALTRTSHSSANGNGGVLSARLPINDNIDGIIEAPGAHHLNLLLKKVRLIDPYNIVQDVCLQQPSVVYYKTLTGITEERTGVAKIYPNPASRLLFIEAENIREAEITDVTGRKIYSIQVNSLNRIEINLQELSLAGGTYFVKVKTGDFVSTQKLFVQH